MKLFLSGHGGVWRLFVFGVIALGALAIAGACGGDAEPTPTQEGGVVATPTAASGDLAPSEKRGGGTLIVAGTLSDIPDTGGQTSQGHEGFRFVGFNISDGLTRWDLTDASVNAGIVPGLAESWEMDAQDPAKWTFRLRRGVKFHDGTDYDADAAIYIFDRIKESASRGEAAHFDPAQAARVRSFGAPLYDWRKIDDYTIEVETNPVFSFLPFVSSFYLSVSPTRHAELGPDEYQTNPAGTGPWKFDKLVPRERLELVPNEDYWGMVPMADRFIYLAMPDAGSRLAALRTGRVNWAEVPPANAVPGLRRDGFQVYLNKTPHTWHYKMYIRPPFDNKNIRIALNYSIDRETLCEDVLNETCIPSYAMMYPGHPWEGDPPRKYTYDPEKSCEMVKAEGYERIRFTVLTTPSGSGQMLPVQMNEHMQSTMKDACFDLEIMYLDWASRGAYRRENNWADFDAYQSSTASQDPYSAFSRNYHTRSQPPVAGNISLYSNPDFDEAIEKAEQTNDVAERNRWLQKANEILNEDAAWLYVAHDLNPRVLSPSVQDFVQPQSWFTDNQLPWVKQ
jgi:peptide/nickel transport system substrate-binding protein